MFGNSSERDFFRRRRRQRQQTSDDDQNQEDPFAGDGEEINMSDADDRNPDINVINEGEEDAHEVQQPEQGKKWFGLFDLDGGWERCGPHDSTTRGGACRLAGKGR